MPLFLSLHDLHFHVGESSYSDTVDCNLVAPARREARGRLVERRRVSTASRRRRRAQERSSVVGRTWNARLRVLFAIAQSRSFSRQNNHTFAYAFGPPSQAILPPHACRLSSQSQDIAFRGRLRSRPDSCFHVVSIVRTTFLCTMHSFRLIKWPYTLISCAYSEVHTKVLLLSRSSLNVPRETLFIVYNDILRANEFIPSWWTLSLHAVFHILSIHFKFLSGTISASRRSFIPLELYPILRLTRRGRWSAL